MGWNVSLQTKDFVIIYNIDLGAETNVISKQNLSFPPKSFAIKSTNVKLSPYNGSSILLMETYILNMSTKHELQSVQLIVIDSDTL